MLAKGSKLLRAGTWKLHVIQMSSDITRCLCDLVLNGNAKCLQIPCLLATWKAICKGRTISRRLRKRHKNLLRLLKIRGDEFEETNLRSQNPALTKSITTSTFTALGLRISHRNMSWMWTKEKFSCFTIQHLMFMYNLSSTGNSFRKCIQ